MFGVDATVCPYLVGSMFSAFRWVLYGRGWIQKQSTVADAPGNDSYTQQATGRCAYQCRERLLRKKADSDENNRNGLGLTSAVFVDVIAACNALYVSSQAAEENLIFVILVAFACLAICSATVSL